MNGSTGPDLGCLRFNLAHREQNKLQQRSQCYDLSRSSPTSSPHSHASLEHALPLPFFFRHVYHCDSLPQPLGSADVCCQPPFPQCSHTELSLSPPWPSLSAFSSDTLWSSVNYIYFVTTYLKMLLCSISLSLISPPLTNASLELELYGMGLSSVQFTVGFLRLELCLTHMHRGGSLGEGMNKG